MKKRSVEEVRQVLETHRRTYVVEPASYLVQAQDGKPEGWFAQVRIFHDVGSHTKVATVDETRSDWRFASEDDANGWAHWIAAEWLEEND